MRRIPVLLALTCISSGLAAAPAEATPAASQWRAEFVNDRTGQSRELVVTAWYPGTDSEERWPLILLAPGRGVAASAYSQFATQLVANGYAVVAVDSPGSGRQVFADGRVVPPDPALAPPPGLMAGPYIEVDRFFAAAAAAGASDLQYVLDQFEAVERTTDKPLAGSVDTREVGVLGHSLGGRIAGAFAAQDPRVAAWIGVEGLAPRDARRGGLGVPALAILSSGIWPYAIDNVRELAWCTRHPTYFAKMQDITHNTITETRDESIAEVALSAGQLRLASMVLVFLYAHLNASDQLIQDWPSGVTVETHTQPAAERPANLECHD